MWWWWCEAADAAAPPCDDGGENVAEAAAADMSEAAGDAADEAADAAGGRMPLLLRFIGRESMSDERCELLLPCEWRSSWNDVGGVRVNWARERPSFICRGTDTEPSGSSASSMPPPVLAACIENRSLLTAAVPPSIGAAPATDALHSDILSMGSSKPGK